MTTARLLAPADTLQATTTLARAFMTYPPLDWTVPPGDHYERLFLMMHAYLTGMAPKQQEAWITEGGMAVAVWAPPGEWQLSRDTLSRIASDLANAVGDRAEYSLRAKSVWHALHPEEPHYYLRLLGTQPKAQRCGLASIALRPLLDRCDNQNIPAYTETSTIENVAFYRRCGFEVVQEFDLPDGGPHGWTLWREPR